MTEQDNKSPVQEAPPMKLDVSVRAIEPKGNLLGFANVKFNDCFVVEDFKILQTDKGLYVGMPSKPDKSSKTGYRTETDTWTDEDGITHTDTYEVPYEYYILHVRLQNKTLSL